MTTCSTCSGSTPARSSAAPMAIPPSSVASSVDRPPPILPTGVRAVARITVLDIEVALLLRGRGERMREREWYRRAAGKLDIVPAHADIGNRPIRQHK